MLLLHQKQWPHIKKLLKEEKLPHALLFSGNLAMEFVEYLHPDFIFVAPIKKEIHIFQIKDLIWRLSLKPAVAPVKVAVIDQAHLMNEEAQSALLKTIEEPKGKTLLILITDYPHALFPTILSRVQSIRVHEISKIQNPKEKTFQEIDQLAKSGLSALFEYAEKISKEPELKEILTLWLHYFRRDLIKNKAILQKIQAIYYSISKTNVSKLLALETLMLEMGGNV